MFSFDELTERRNTNSYKWDIRDNELPMWVADMDFKTAPAIIDFLKHKVDEGIYGYQIIPDAWYLAYQSWWKSRHHLEIERDSLIFCTGVVPAISTAVRKLTTPAEKVIVLTPVYNIFFNSIYNNGRIVVECPLKYIDHHYEIDFADFEAKLSDPQVTLLIFCNPHNPVGKIWDRETLARVGELCDKYHVTVISDEIHCDLTDPGVEYVPYASASEICKQQSVTCIAPTKAFNIAGLQTAAVMVPNPVLRHKMWRALNTDEVAEPNVFAMGAAIAAFTKGAEWLDELRQYIYDNKQVVQEFVERELHDLKLIPSQATYLLWFDCSAWSNDSVALCDQIRKKTGLYLSEGREYGQNGASFFRMNIACPRARVLEGLKRLKRALDEI